MRIVMASLFSLPIALGSVVAFAQTGGTVGPEDQSFLEQASGDNQGEIRISVLAQELAEDPSVKAFARLMISDHGTLESLVGTVAQKLQVALPTHPSQDAQQAAEQLRKLSGSAFDQQFMTIQVQDHQTDIQKFQQELSATSDPDIQHLVASALPILEQHLRLAEATQSLIQNGSQSSPSVLSGNSFGQSSAAAPSP
jgi:putative membrane protein